MTTLRLYTDEDIYRSVAAALRSRGVDAVSTPECGRRGESDESQLAYSAAEGRAIVSFNVRDFARLHTAWLKLGSSHAGIIISQQRSIGETVRRLAALAEAFDSETMIDRLEFLGDW